MSGGNVTHEKTGEEYLPQGPEVMAIHDAVAHQHREGGGFFDCGTYMETGRDALKRLDDAGFSVVENDRLTADREALIQAYGLLWVVLTGEPRVNKARRILLSRMTKDMQKRGIEFARNISKEQLRER